MGSSAAGMLSSPYPVFRFGVVFRQAASGTETPKAAVGSKYGFAGNAEIKLLIATEN